MPVLTRSKQALKVKAKRLEEFEAIPQPVQNREPVLLTDLWIQTKGKKEIRDFDGTILQEFEPPALIRFEPNGVQVTYLDQLCPLWREGVIDLRGVREIILKARQFGFSTLIDALFFLMTVNNTDVNTVVMADEAGNTETLFQKMRLFWENLPDNKRPRTRGNSTRHLYFVDIRSKISVITAGSGTAGRSRTIHNLHCSELPHWPDPSILTGLLPSVPDDTGNIFFESTANGEDPLFCQEYRKAKKGESDFTSRFFAWWEHEEYQSPVEGFVRTDEDITVANKYDFDRRFGKEIADAKLNWRRRKKRSPGQGTLFGQEYPGDDEEAFLVSGTRFLTEWDTERHCYVPGEIEVQRHWQRIGGYDWGIGAPACFLLGAVDPRGGVLVVDEVYGSDRTDPEQARDVVACLQRNNLKPDQVPIYADPAMWAAKRDQTTGNQIRNVQAFFDAGLKMIAASNNRLHGWANVKRYLHDSVDDRACLLVSQSCPNLIRTAPLMIRAKANPEDMETKMVDDHGWDTARYLLSAKPRPSLVDAPTPKVDLSKQPRYHSIRGRKNERKL